MGLLKINIASARAKEVHLGGCKARPSGSEMRIEFDGLLEHLSGKFYALACPLLEEFPRTKIKLVCLHVLRRRFKETALLALGEREPQRVNHTAGNFILDREDVFDLSVEPLRPQLVTIPRIDELHSGADTVAGLADAALKKRLHTESSPNLARIDGCSTKCEAGCSGRDVEYADFGKRIQNLLCNTVAEIFLIAFGAEIRKRQHAKRANRFLSLLLGFVRLWNTLWRSDLTVFDYGDV